MSACCENACADDDATLAATSLNRKCGCSVVAPAELHARIAHALEDAAGLDPNLHAHLFAPQALFVDRASLATMEHITRALFAVSRTPAYVERVLAWAPPLARHDPRSPGGVIGLDFHLTERGPRLIEINTNPGGLLLNAFVLDSVDSCVPHAWTTWTTTEAAVAAGTQAWLDEAKAQLGHAPSRMAIVDEDPPAQFLYPEFRLYRRAFEQHGVPCVIHAPAALSWDGRTLRDAGGAVDFVYNRLTDFALGDAGSAALATAYRQGAVALSPHPRAHALLADKRNLAVLGERDFLLALGLSAGDATVLAGGIPATVQLTADNREALWADRAGYFFKPANGYGSRGSYRGDKLTRRVWDAIAGADYVAQAFEPPAVRISAAGVPLKTDVRCYATERGVILFAARLYQGQTTNMRTPHGGFAAVLTTRDEAKAAAGSRA
jgi:hypothetical protein